MGSTWRSPSSSPYRWAIWRTMICCARLALSKPHALRAAWSSSWGVTVSRMPTFWVAMAVLMKLLLTRVDGAALAGEGGETEGEPLGQVRGAQAVELAQLLDAADLA